MWAVVMARMEGGKSAFKILMGTPSGKRPLGRPRHRWEDNIRMNVEEIGINVGNWVDSAQDMDYSRVLMNEALNLRIPKAMELVSQKVFQVFMGSALTQYREEFVWGTFRS